MRSWDAPQSWPPDVCDELRTLFSELRSRQLRPQEVDRHPSLYVAMNELDAWLTDTRPYDHGKHRWAWSSMIDDITAALGTRGSSLKTTTPTLEELREELAIPRLGGNLTARQRARKLNSKARTELRKPTAAAAGFDDLVAELQAPATPPSVVYDRLHALEAALRTADRSLQQSAWTLAGIADNSAWDVALARHDLDGTPLPDNRLGHNEDAGLSLDDRIELSRRIITQPRQPGQHVIWFAYERARFAASSWRLEFGPVTFFEGPVLVGALEQIAEAGVTGPDRDIPDELLAGQEHYGVSCRDLQPGADDIEDWVNVRVDLGDSPYSDPARVAREQADALVRLAAFHSGGTSWKPLSGYLHVVDGHLRTTLGSFSRPLDERWADSDYTDEQLEELQPHLAHHLPVDDPQLQELIDAAGTLDASTETEDPASLLQHVRIIELLATRCGDKWKPHLKDSLAVRWAHHRVLNEVHRTVELAVNDGDLRRSGAMPHLSLDPRMSRLLSRRSCCLSSRGSGRG